MNNRLEVLHEMWVQKIIEPYHIISYLEYSYLERAAREHRRPLAGMFRVRGVPGKCSSFVQHGCLLGLFGNSWGFLCDADGTSVCCRLFFWHLLTISKTLGRTSHASLIAQGALAEAWGMNNSSASFRTFAQVRRR